MAAIPDSMIIGDHPTNPVKKVGFEEPVLVKEGNLVHVESVDKEKFGLELKSGYGQVSPIPRLAQVAALNKPIPTAGQYGIEHVIPKDLLIPSECYLYEDQPWVLEKLNPAALDLPEPAEPVQLSEATLAKLDALEQAAKAAARAQFPEYYRNFVEQMIPTIPIMADTGMQINKAGDVQVFRTDVQIEVGKDGRIIEQSEPSVDEKIQAGYKHSKSPRSSKSPVSPGKRFTPASPAKKTSVSPAPTGRSKSAKSPGRSVSPRAKIVAASGTKKIMNAKVDLEIVEKKN